MALATFLLLLDPRIPVVATVVHGVIASRVASKLSCGHEWILICVFVIGGWYGLKSTRRCWDCRGCNWSRPDVVQRLSGREGVGVKR